MNTLALLTFAFLCVFTSVNAQNRAEGTIHNFLADLSEKTNSEVIEEYFVNNEFTTNAEYESIVKKKLDKFRKIDLTNYEIYTYSQGKKFLKETLNDKNLDRVFVIVSNDESYLIKMLDPSKIESIILMKKGNQRYFL